MIGTVKGDANPLTFWWYATADAERDKLVRALEMSIERWRSATGLNLSVSNNAHHWVRLRPPEDMGGAWGHTGGTWDSVRIRIINDQPVDVTANLITHEIGHCLGRSNAHTDVHEDMMFASYHRSDPNIITQATLDYVAHRHTLLAPKVELVHPYA